MPRRLVYTCFALFGAFWGSWGASLPAIRDQAGLGAGQLGTALLFIGAGALPAMLVAGRAVDRWPQRATAVLLPALGATGVLAAVAGRDMLSLALALALLGAASGAADVAINTAAGAAQRAHGGAVIAHAHASFSAAVVLASLLTGVVRSAELPIVTPFAAVAAATLLVGARLVVAPGRPAERREAALRGVRLGPLLAIGALGALAFAVENAHQSWSAVYLGDELGAGAATAAAGPAIFAAAVALTRVAAGPLGNSRPRLVLVGGAALAAAGTSILALAPTLAVALAGLALAAAGTAVLFPTLIVVLTGRVADAVRGAATSAVTTVAYLGFLAGPAYVGAWADAVGLPGAMLAVAGLAAVLALLTPLLRTRVPSPS